MRRAFVAISKALFNFLYRLLRKGERAHEVVFLSRQADEPSYDFAMLARAFEARGWTATMHLKKVTKRNLLGYAGHVLAEVRLLARCQFAVLDRYDPVVSLLDFECEPGTPQADGIHGEFPARPVILQLWHAFGAYKKFGYQSIGTAEGHAHSTIELFNIHRNYSWVACSCEDAREAYAEAFAYPIERVVVLSRPEYDELVERRAALDAQAAADAQPTRRVRVLMAPTLRKSGKSEHPFRDLYQQRAGFEQALNADVTWSFHPLEEGLPAPGNASDDLMACDIVVTDYSSIVYEAFMLGKKAVFYIPDLEQYLVSPGLNANPAELCPDLCTYDSAQLAEMLNAFAVDEASYPQAQFAAFAKTAFDNPAASAGSEDVASTAADLIVDFANEKTAGR